MNDPSAANLHELLPPVLDDSLAENENPQSERILNWSILIAMGISILILLISLIPQSPLPVTQLPIVMLLIELAAYIVMRTGRIQPATIIFSIGLFGFASYTAAITGGITSPAIFLLIIIVTVASLFWSGLAGIILGVLSGLVGLALYILELTGSLPAPLAIPSSVGHWLGATICLIVIAVLLFNNTKILRNALEQARRNQAAQLQANQELEETRLNLQNQVAQHSNELEQRSKYLQASIEVSHAAASLRDIQKLLDKTVDLIRERFDLYYVGIFLSDPNDEWAILRAGTGSAGSAMIARNHRIKIGSGMIGWSITNAQPRVALNIDADAVRLANPELPETRSESAIPLRLRDKVLGAITVQSQKPDAFGEVEIDSFLALADLIAISLENTRLLTESQIALEEAQRSYGETSRHAWRQLLHTGGASGYRYDRHSINPIVNVPGSADWLPEMRQAAQTRKSVQRLTKQAATLYLPIPIRDQVLGVVNLTRSQIPITNWADDEIALLESLAEQLGLAIESARLYQDTRRSAMREQLTGDVTTRIRETLNIETVLRTAVQEIQKAVGAPEVIISLKTPTASTSATSQDPG